MNLNQLVIDPLELAEWVPDNVAENICIVDLSSEHTYLTGHIPGAIFLPFQYLLCGTPPAPGKIASTENLEKVFSFLGLNKDTHFIVYDDEGGGWAGRFIWTLDAIGHKHYSYLNGGLTAWKKANLPLEKNAHAPEKSNVKITIDPSPIAEIKDILEGLENNSIQVWDARSPMEFSGQQTTARKNGHIPGAINCEWTLLMDNSKGLRIREDAKDFLLGCGITGERPIITHCQAHHRSGFTYLVGKTLGYDIRAYHGAWAEWGNHPDTPVER